MFCVRCGKPAARLIPEGDDRPRAVCTACGAIRYVNPRTVVGTLVESEGSVLLCRRAIEPRRGYWTLPAGFLELGESSAAGAIRETWEEAGARVEVLAPLVHVDIPAIGQIYVLYRARPLTTEISAGVESLEVAWTPYSELPWEDLAFAMVRETLRLRIDDRARGEDAMHMGYLERPGEGIFSADEQRLWQLREHRRVILALGQDGG